MGHLSTTRAERSGAPGSGREQPD